MAHLSLAFSTRVILALDVEQRQMLSKQISVIPLPTKAWWCVFKGIVKFVVVQICVRDTPAAQSGLQLPAKAVHVGIGSCVLNPFFWAVAGNFG